MGKDQYYTLSVNIPVEDKEQFDDWQTSCLQEHNDGRWNKIISDHFKVKEIVRRLEEQAKLIKVLNAKLDNLMEIE